MGILDEMNRMNKQLTKISRGNAKTFTKINRDTKKTFTKINKDNVKMLKKAMNSWVKSYISKEKRVPINAKRKKEVYDEYKGRCDMCSKKNPLEIHHKNLKSSDNALRNLRLLCPNHHTEQHQKQFKKVYAKEYHKKKK